MPGDYTVLATIHDEIGMGSFARHITPRLIDFAQRNDWLGRQVADLGCGSGTSIRWLAQHGYIVTGVDNAPAMLNIAKQVVASQSLNVTWLTQDVSKLSGLSGLDLAISLDVLHEFDSLKEVEAVFKSVHPTLKDGKLFIFDMYTIEGLVERNRVGSMMEYDGKGLTVFIQNQFDYERQIQRREYIIFRQQGELWARQNTFRTLRAYPVQAITALVNRCGYEIANVLNLDLSPHKPGDSTERVIIIAQKR